MSIKAHIPNTITLCNLLCGCMAIISAFQSNDPAWGLPDYSLAMIFIGLAALFDFCDGFAARMLHAYSDVGKELDSLSDLVSFGVAPAMILFNFISSSTGGSPVAWLALFIAAMGALRLARFNVDTRQTTSFIGLPIPASALFWIGAIGWMQVHGYPSHGIVIALIIIMSLLMVSPLPMFSLKFKSWGWRENLRRYVIIAAAVLFIVTDGLAGLAWTILLYILISMFGRRIDA